jgi:type II secretory pathway component PulF
MKLKALLGNPGVRAMRKRRLNLLADISRVLQTEKADLYASLRRVSDRNAGKPIEQAYKDILGSLKQGKANGISEALRPYFPEREFLLVKAFDMGAKGDVERGQGFATAVKIMRPLDELRKGFTKLLLTFIASMVVVIVLWLGIAPAFGVMITEMIARDKWFTVSSIVIESGEWMLQYWWLVIPTFAGFIAMVVWAMPNWRGATRRKFDQFMPGFVIYREYSSVLTLVALACLIRANQGLDWAFNQIRRLGSTWQSDYIEAMKTRSKQYSASKMLDVGYFPNELIDRIALREGSDNLQDNLSSVALQNIDELTESMTKKLNAARKVVVDVSKALGGLVAIAIMLLILAAMQSLTTTLKG